MRRRQAAAADAGAAAALRGMHWQGRSAKSAHADAWSAPSRATRAIGAGSTAGQDRGVDGECVGRMNECWDDQQRLRPGVVPGWGMNWWFAEQGITRADRAAMSSEQCLAVVMRYWRAVAASGARKINHHIPVDRSTVRMRALRAR